VYATINTFIRTIQHEFSSPWIIINIQDIERKQTIKNRNISYEVTCVNTIYQLIDWLLYMNMLLAQIDMVIIEIVTNLIATNITTFIYLRSNIHVSENYLTRSILNNEGEDEYETRNRMEF